MTVNEFLQLLGPIGTGLGERGKYKMMIPVYDPIDEKEHLFDVDAIKWDDDKKQVTIDM